MYKILFADDEENIRETTFDYLTAKGFEVVLARDGYEAVEKANENNVDLIILDIMMPRKNGFEACKEIRENHDTPILFLSALGDEENLLSGYMSGADDYITKPFPLSVLAQKCKKIIDRTSGEAVSNKITLNGITLDSDKCKTYIENKEIDLISKDFLLLEYLMQNKNIVLNRNIILSRIWGYDFEGDERVVDTHIKRLRKALGEKSECIKTKINVGYYFEVK